jgi:hypothetical protein
MIMTFVFVFFAPANQAHAIHKQHCKSSVKLKYSECSTAAGFV